MELGTLVALVLTVMVYCYLGKDIPLLHAIYRLAAYVFVGVALGYGAVMAWHGVLVPRLLLRLGGGEWVYLVPLVLCLLLLSRVSRSASGMGNLTIAFLFGVGAALSVGGALVGTLIPQIWATAQPLNPAYYEGAALEGGIPSPIYLVVDALWVLFVTISTLLYFHFTAKRGIQRFAGTRGRTLQAIAGFGRVFIMFSLGALFAVAAISRMSLLVDRIRFLIEAVWSVVGSSTPTVQ
jgi:hypothetical protein